MQYGALPLKSVDPVQPIVILGGFLIAAEAYKPMAASLKLQGVSNVLVVPMTRLDWLLTTERFGWRRVLDCVDAMVTSSTPVTQWKSHVDRPQFRWSDAASISQQSSF